MIKLKKYKFIFFWELIKITTRLKKNLLMNAMLFIVYRLKGNIKAYI